MKSFILLRLIACAIPLLSASVSLAQGCSDAGSCALHQSSTAGRLDSLEHKSKTEAGISFSGGIGEEGVLILQLIPEFSWQISNKLRWTARTSFQSINGNLAETRGIGDVLSGFSYTIDPYSPKTWRFSAAVKIPVNAADANEEGRPLPMPYQTSLGTFDALFSVQRTWAQWDVSLNYQTILSDKNDNGFLHLYWPDNSDAADYFESNQLRRGDDVSLRIDRYFGKKAYRFQAGALAIYRLNEDRITNATGTELSLEGSEGLTLNVLGSVQRSWSKRSALQLLLGFPLIIREVRADGLTRAAVLQISYTFKI